jgi:hypothetical protein
MRGNEAMVQETPQFDPESVVFVDAALDAWDRKRSKLATKYMKNIRGALINSTIIDREFPRVAILAALTEQPDVAVNLYKAFLQETSDSELMTFTAWDAVGGLAWSAEQLNLVKYAEFFGRTIEPGNSGYKRASREVMCYVTNEDLPYMSWLGTVENPSPIWANGPVPRLNILLEQMCRTATFRQFPAGNDWGWTREQYDAELREDARYARARLGFDPDMPEFPADDQFWIPEGMTRLPPMG